MVDEGGRVAADRSVDGKFFRQGNDLDDAGSRLRTQARADLPLASDELTGIRSDLLALGDWYEREAAVVVDCAGSDVECLQVVTQCLMESSAFATFGVLPDLRDAMMVDERVSLVP